MGNSRKIKNSGRGGMEFPGVSKKQYVEFPGDLLFGLRIFKGSNTISRSGAFFNLELPGVKK